MQRPCCQDTATAVLLTQSERPQWHVYDRGCNVDKYIWEDGRDSQEYYVVEEVPPPPVHLQQRRVITCPYVGLKERPSML